MSVKLSTEQIGTNGRFINYKPGQRKWLKRRSNRVWRRAAKVLLDNAPIKRQLRGYDD